MKIYLAGKYSDNNIIGVLNNIKKGISIAAKLIKEGNNVFCPFLDYQYHFFENLTKQDYQRNSMSFVEWADELWILPNSENSGGTQREITKANELKIPVRYL